MTFRNILSAISLGAATLALASAVTPHAAYAQSSTTGGLMGVIKDETGAPLDGVTVTAVSGSNITETAITENGGSFRLTGLVPGTYLVTLYFGESAVEVRDVKIGVNKTTPLYRTINTKASEVIVVQSSGQLVDVTSTNQGITIDKNYYTKIPVPGRDFESTLGAAAGSQGDGVGVSFSGSSSLENQYVVDGVNTTGLQFGTVGSPVINEFIEEIEVITGGYNAEYGRATGGVVNVVTKTGTNEFAGSVFGYISPGFLVADAERVPSQVNSIQPRTDLNFQGDFGFEVGGPIIKDKAWFYVGVVPSYSLVDVNRAVYRRTDCRATNDDGTLSACEFDQTTGKALNQDGAFDRDPDTGFFLTEVVEEKVVQRDSLSFNLLGKVNFAPKPEHQGQISVIALPGKAEGGTVLGKVEDMTVDIKQLTMDIGGKWTSKFNNDKTEVQVGAGYHFASTNVSARDKTLNLQPQQILREGTLGNWIELGNESALVKAGCEDGTGDDPYELIANCPVTERAFYAFGGPGTYGTESESRLAIKGDVTHRLNFKGNHEIKLGGDYEDNTLTSLRLFSGGAYLENVVGSYVIVNRWVQLKPENSTDTRFDNTCVDSGRVDIFGNPVSFECDFLSGVAGSKGTTVESRTVNYSGYLRDSWQIKPNLTLNVGMRYESQALRYADELQGTIDAFTKRQLGKNAMELNNLWAPRVGLIWDWTKEGKSKLFANWGRFYEAIPLRINFRSFGGESSYRQIFGVTGGGNSCGATDPLIGGPNGTGCLVDENATADQAQLIGAAGVYVAPGIKPQYLDELVLGVEYELVDDLKVGVTLQNRRLGRVIEDVSTDGADTYIIANPGEWSQAEEDKVLAQLAAAGTPEEVERLEKELALYRGIRLFDKPTRDYNALQFTVTRRFSKAFYMQGSYTYAQHRGNFPGLISYDNGQVDPNISSQYDLIELLGNRVGALPLDRPHYIKIDGYYTHDMKKAGELTFGVRARALSGVPVEAIGGHHLYGPAESFLLPRGAMGRTSFVHGVDLKLAYGRSLSRGMKLEVFGDVFNVYNRQEEGSVDEIYTDGSERNNFANPIIGGSYEDLIWLKALDDNGKEPGSPVPVIRNKNFGRTTSRGAPLSVRFGVRLSF